MDWRYLLAAVVIGGTVLSLWGGTRAQTARAISGSVEPPYLPLETIERYAPAMRREKVSELARGRRGFLPAYRRAKGDPERLPKRWRRRRRGFIAQSMKEARSRGEALYDDRGEPTRRHLALIAWAYSPSPGGL
jgi:hypothetical protein